MEPPLRDAAIRAARRWGTPLYLYDLPRLRRDAATVREAFPDPWLRLYSLKANGLPAIVHEVASAGGYGASAVSVGELRLARRAGLPARVTALEGIGKGEREVRAAVHAARRGEPLLWVSVESADETAALAAAAQRAGVAVDVLIRLNPGVLPETHAGLAVGGAASKFGVTMDELATVVEAGGGRGGPLQWRGVHVHVGSQLGAVDAWRDGIRAGLTALRLRRGGLPAFDTLDVGGGFPVAGENELVPLPARFATEATAAISDVPADVRPRRLAVEPGRFPVARAGWLVASVLHARERERAAIVLDAGMTELMRPALYGARHPIAALVGPGTAGDADPARPTLVDGPVCESTDRFGEFDLRPLRRGDLVAIGLAGAYGSSMASTYNGRPRPPEVAWDGRELALLRRRGSLRGLP